MRDLWPLLLVGALVVGAGAIKKPDTGGGSGQPDPGGSCIGCCPGTSTYEGMLTARAFLQTKYGSWANTNPWAKFAHTAGYGMCPGYNDF